MEASNKSKSAELINKLVEIEDSVKSIQARTDESFTGYLGSIENFISSYTDEIDGYLKYLEKQQSSIEETLNDIGSTVEDVCKDKPLSISTELRLADTSKSLQMYSEKLETEIRVIRYLLDGLSSMYGNIYDTIAEHIKFTNKREEVNETAEEDVPDDNERIEFDVDADNLTADEIAELNAELVRSFNEANGLNSSLQNQEIDNEKLLENLEEEIMNNSKKPKNSPGYLTKEGLRQIIFPSIK
jgi:hypothetical protein